MLNFGYLFADTVASQPDAIALIQEERRLTYGELEARCQRVAMAFHQSGPIAGERIAILFENDWRYPELIFGVMRAGGVAVPLNPRWGDDTLSEVLKDVRPAMALASPGLESRLIGLLSGVDNGNDSPLIITMMPSAKALSYDAFLEQNVETETADLTKICDPSATCLMLFTTGSTGAPKGVRLTHRSQWWNARTMLGALEISTKDVALVAVPVCHKNAMIAAIKPFLLRGGTLVFLRRFMPESALQTIIEHDVTYTTGVPAIYEGMIRVAEENPALRPQTLCYGLCGSATVPESLFTRAKATLQIELAESYGLTEIAVPMANRRSQGLVAGSCGQLSRGMEARLIDPTTGIESQQEGELWLRGDGLFGGYWHRPAVEAERLQDGWFRTGDQMKRNANGYYFFLGRDDDMINVAGENVYPREVERIILREPTVQEVIVVDRVHPTKNRVPVAFVIPPLGQTVDVEAIRQRFFTHGPAYAYPRIIVQVDAFPFNAVGKPDRKGLTQRAAYLDLQQAFYDLTIATPPA